MNLGERIRTRVGSTYPGAQVVARGRRRIKFAHPTQPNRFVSVFGQSPIHLRGTETEIDTALVPGTSPIDDPWLYVAKGTDFHVYALPGNETFDSGQLIRYVHPPSGSEITFEPQQLQWTNDLGQIEALANPANVLPTVVDDKVQWLNAYGAGRHFSWEVQTARLQKLLTLDTAPAAPPQFIIDGGNPRLKLAFIFQKSAGVTLWVDGVPWDEKANNPVSTISKVEFRDASNNALWEFSPGFAAESGSDGTGAPMPEITPTTWFRKTGPNLLVEVHVPWSWLALATYPVYVDPPITDRVGASDEDADEDNNDSNFSATNTKLTVSSSTSGKDGQAGMWFDISADVSQGDTINAGTKLTIDVSTGPVRDDPDCTFYCEDVDTAANFTTTADIVNRTRTTANFAWNTTNIGSGLVDTPDVDTEVAEVVARPGWTGPIVVIMQGNTGTNQTLQFDSYDGDTTNAPLLTVDYTAAAGGDIIAPLYSRIRAMRSPVLTR